MEVEQGIISSEIRKGSLIRLINERLGGFNDAKKSKKDNAQSLDYRNQGNKIFVLRDHDTDMHMKIWESYSKSIACASNESEELATAYSNRSAFLFHIRKYPESILDIDQALKFTKSNNLLVKLYCRKVICMVLAGFNIKNTAAEVYRKAAQYLRKIEDSPAKENLVTMINKAKTVLDTNKADIVDKLKKYKIENKITGIKIESNEKDGKYLVAARDIRPGESLCVENYYVAYVNPIYSHRYCSHCLGFSWTSIPCRSCNNHMYCSEDCLKKAWNEYHEIECDLQLVVDPNNFDERFSLMSFRALLACLKEAGSISNLRKELGNVNDEDHFANNFKSLYRLKVINNDFIYRNFAKHCIVMTTYLAKSTKFFGEDFKYNPNNLTENEDITFVCKFLLRINMIIRSNYILVKESQEKCDGGPECRFCISHKRAARGFAIVPLASLFKHQCNSNMKKIFTDRTQVVYYSIKFIKKGSKLFDAHFGHYMDGNFIERGNYLDDLKRKFDAACDCEACRKSWTQIRSDPIPRLERDPHGREILDVLMKWHDIISPYEDDYHQFSKKALTDITKRADLLIKLKIHEHTWEYQTLFHAIACIYDRMYGIHTKIPRDCKRM